MVSSSTMLRAVNPVPAILTRLVASQDDPSSLPPEQTLKEPSTRPLPVRHRHAEFGPAAPPPEHDVDLLRRSLSSIRALVSTSPTFICFCAR